MKKKFIKRPIIIEAVQFDGRNYNECFDFIGGGVKHPSGKIIIKTLEGDMYCGKKDWIIKGIKGEFYPCKPDIFEETYTTFGTNGI